MENSTIEAICSEFQIDSVKSFEVLREIEGNNTIIKVRTSEETFIMKLYFDAFTTSEGLQIQGEMCTIFVKYGLPFVPRIQTKGGNYYVEMSHQGKQYLATMESYIEGEIIESLTLENTYEIGKLLALQHEISAESGIAFGYGTSWSLFGGNKTNRFGDYDENELCFRELIECLQEYDYLEDWSNTISKLYHNLREELYGKWHLLPKGPVQGDFCPYNMIANDTGKIWGIFDYNLAGDEVYINECCALAVYLAFSHAKHEGSEQEHLRLFFEAYLKGRILMPDEEKLVPPLLQLIRPFRYERVDEIIMLIREGKQQQVLEKLEETVEMLQLSYEL